MISTPLQAEFESCFPFIRECSPAFVENFYRKAQYAELPEATSICDEGQYCSHLAMLLDGVGRVYKLSSSGREVTLYRVYGGESCVLTASCIMNGDSFPAMAVSETGIRAILVSPGNVVDWFCEEPQWKHFVFRLLSNRLGNIISVVEEVAFKRIDVRLAEQFVRILGRGKTAIDKTHAELAADVGSSREVISRILRDFAARGLISTHRGRIEILDREALHRLASQ